MEKEWDAQVQRVQKYLSGICVEGRRYQTASILEWCPVHLPRTNVGQFWHVPAPVSPSHWEKSCPAVNLYKDLRKCFKLWISQVTKEENFKIINGDWDYTHTKKAISWLFHLYKYLKKKEKETYIGTLQLPSYVKYFSMFKLRWCYLVILATFTTNGSIFTCPISVK